MVVCQFPTGGIDACKHINNYYSEKDTAGKFHHDLNNCSAVSAVFALSKAVDGIFEAYVLCYAGLAPAETSGYSKKL